MLAWLSENSINRFFKWITTWFAQFLKLKGEGPMSKILKFPLSKPVFWDGVNFYNSKIRLTWEPPLKFDYLINSILKIWKVTTTQFIFLAAAKFLVKLKQELQRNNFFKSICLRIFYSDKLNNWRSSTES
jgi:hypothetical protein